LEGGTTSGCDFAEIFQVSIGFWDIESRSTVPLDVAGAWRYAADPTTEIFCVAYAIDDGDPQIWVPGDPLPQELLAADEIVAHNFAFERANKGKSLRRDCPRSFHVSGEDGQLRGALQGRFIIAPVDVNVSVN
jgi:hypothetical protein